MHTLSLLATLAFLGLTKCHKSTRAGTNMVLRSRALREADWFPLNSVTEDWALGMRFKKLGYRCRYVNVRRAVLSYHTFDELARPSLRFEVHRPWRVQQYLAIGEAPDSTQQAFQQRSRWSKGHFQVFWGPECPLIDRRLSLFNKLAYSSTCVSYLSTGISVPVLNLVPMLTIHFGWFPIALNFWTVASITAYYCALNALSFYCRSYSHFKVRSTQIASTLLSAQARAQRAVPPGVVTEQTDPAAGRALSTASPRLHQ